MATIHRTVACPLEGFEGVTVTYNLMASANEVNAFSTDFDAAPGLVIAGVSGWPEELNAEPFGNDAPLAFLIWARQTGIKEAIRAYAADPLS